MAKTASNFLGWLSPEMLMLEQYSEAGDVFSFGVLLWMMLTNKMPFEGEPINIINRAIVNDSARPEITLKHMESVENFNFYDVNTGLGYVDLVNSCWSQKMEDRPRLHAVHTIVDVWYDEAKKVVSI